MKKKEIDAMAKELALELAEEFDVALGREQVKLSASELFDHVVTTILMRGDQSSVDLLRKMRIALDGDTRCTIVHS
jgi:hypothetical protein